MEIIFLVTKEPKGRVRGIRTRDLIGKVVENMMRVGSNLCYAEMDPSGRYGRVSLLFIFVLLT